MERFFGGLALAAFMAVATFGPGALLGAVEWPFGVGPYTGEGQACIAASVVATKLNTMDQAETPEEAKRQLEQAGKAMKALADAVSVEPQHGRFQRISSSIEESRSAIDRGDLDVLISSLATFQENVGAVNRWYASTCSSWTIRLPISLNQIYAGGLPTFV